MSSAEDLCSESNAMISKSSGRGSFITTLGCRPALFSSACNLAKSVSGVSSVNGSIAAAAFIKFGEPGGQSTGSLRHRDDCRTGVWDRVSSSLKANWMWAIGSPKFEPSAMYATLLKAQHVLHVVQARLLAVGPLSGTQGAVGEGLAAGSFMRQFQPLA